MASRNRRFVSQAALEALVRFGPELSGLKELRRQATSNLALGVHQAQATSAGIRSAIAQAQPQVSSIYDKGGLDQARAAHSLVGQDLAALTGPGVDRFKAAGAVEQGGAIDRLTEAKANALGDLQSRGVRAKEGEQYQIKQARQQFVSDLTSVLSRKQDLQREKGAFSASEVDKLANDAADRQLRKDIASSSNDTRLAVAGVDASGKPIPGRHPDGSGRKGSSSGRLPGGAKLQTQSAHNKLVAGVSSAKDEAGDFVANAIKAGKGRGWINKQLSHGIPGYTVHDPQTGRVKIDKSGAPVTAPGLKAVPEIQRNILLDLAFYGGVSHVTATKLHHLGYSVAHLHYKVAKPQEIKQRRGANTAGQIVGALLGGIGVK